jgi:hypothetical protein
MRLFSVYDGTDGADVARLQRSGDRGITLSPDANLIAVVAGKPGKKGEIVNTVNIYQLPSGRALASAVHDRIRKGPRAWLQNRSTVAFTADGKHLIASGMSTRVWRING